MQKPLLWTLVVLALAFAITAADAHAKPNSFGLDFSPACDMELPRPITGDIETLFQQAEQFAGNNENCLAAQKYYAVTQLATDQRFHDAMFRIIDMLHKAGEYDASITAAKEYIQWHPVQSQERTEYAYYMIGLNFFLERNGVLQDQKETQKAQLAFADYLEKYPNGRYHDEALNYMKNSYEELAKREIEVGRHYLSVKQYTAAAVRLQQVPLKFKNSKHLPEALFLISIAYTALDKDKEAAAVLVLLQKLFPGVAFTTQTEQFLAEIKVQRAAEQAEKPSRWKRTYACGFTAESDGEKCVYSLQQALAKLGINLTKSLDR